MGFTHSLCVSWCHEPLLTSFIMLFAWMLELTFNFQFPNQMFENSHGGNWKSWKSIIYSYKWLQFETQSSFLFFSFYKGSLLEKGNTNTSWFLLYIADIEELKIKTDTNTWLQYKPDTSVGRGGHHGLGSWLMNFINIPFYMHSILGSLVSKTLFPVHLTFIILSDYYLKDQKGPFLTYSQFRDNMLRVRG